MGVKKRNMLSKIIILILLITYCFVSIFPLFYVTLSSFKDSRTLFRKGMDLSLDLSTMSLKNYDYILFGKGNVYVSWYKNSVIIVIIYTVLSVLFTSSVGYGLGAYRFKGNNAIFLTVLFVMMIPLEVLMLPLYKLVVKLNIINTYWGVVLPFVVNPMAIFFFRQYTKTLSTEFIEAGRIDGCTEIGIFVRIMAPLMKPAFGAMTILMAMQNWNAFIWPMIVMRTNKMLTLPVGLNTLLTPYGDNYDMLLSGSVLAILPIIILFLCNQKAFISGLSSGGVKG